MTTYYVSSAAAGGGAGTSGDPWTLAEGLGATGLAAGDVVRIQADGTYSVGASIAIGATAGTSGAPITFVGASSGGSIDGSIPTIQASSSITGGMIAFGTGVVYVRLRLLKLDGNSLADHCVYQSVDGNGNAVIGCEITGATNDGAAVRGASSYAEDGWSFDGCSIHHNGGWGINYSTAGRLHLNLAGCAVQHNSIGGAQCGKYTGHVIGNLVADNGGPGFSGASPTGYAGTIIYGNTFANNTGDGLNMPSVSWLANNAFTGNGGYGVNLNGMSVAEGYPKTIDNNAVYGNTSGQTDVAGGTLPGAANVTSDPAYNAPGADDYRLQSSSPLLGAGMGGTSIGAFGAVPGGGGSSLPRIWTGAGRVQ